MLDTSSAIEGDSNFQSTLSFAKSVFSTYKTQFENKKIRFGFVTFSTTPTVVFGFDKMSSFSDVSYTISLDRKSANINATLI